MEQAEKDRQVSITGGLCQEFGSGRRNICQAVKCSEPDHYFMEILRVGEESWMRRSVTKPFPNTLMEFDFRRQNDAGIREVIDSFWQVGRVLPAGDRLSTKGCNLFREIDQHLLQSVTNLHHGILCPWILSVEAIMRSFEVFD